MSALSFEAAIQLLSLERHCLLLLLEMMHEICVARKEQPRSSDVDEARGRLDCLPTSAYENLNHTAPDTRSRLHTQHCSSAESSVSFTNIASQPSE